MANSSDALDGVFSDDLLFQILARVPISSRPTCLFACRRWRRLAYDPTFASLNAVLTKTDSGFITQVLHHGRYQISFLSEHRSRLLPLPLPFLNKSVHIEATAPEAGLLLCVSHAGRVPGYYVVRPGAGEHRRIPNPRTRFFMRASAMWCKGNSFKIVRISEPRRTSTQEARLICEVFESSTGRWKRSGDLPNLVFRSGQGKVVGGKACWMVDDYEAKGGQSCAVFVFDLRSQRGRLVRGPADGGEDEGMGVWRMVPWEARLCLVRAGEKEMEVWTMAADDGWERKRLVSLERLMKGAFAFEDGVGDDEVVLLETLYRELWYDLRGKQLVDGMSPPESVFKLHLLGTKFEDG